MQSLISNFRRVLATKEFQILIGLIILFVVIRSIHFTHHLNFSADQGDASSIALQMWQDKKPLWQGNAFSFHLGDRSVHQGPYIYYFQLLFLFLGNFNPVYASYAFMLFCAGMTIPLYYGSKFLLNKPAALFLTVVYVLNPYYIHYTRFLWNPNYQFALVPLLILFMGLFHKNKQMRYFFCLSLVLSVISQLHYQFFIGLVGLLIYYFGFKKVGWQTAGWGALGFIIGFLPFLYYELTHKFENLQTLKLFIENWQILYYQNKDQSSFAPHYYLALSFLALLLVVGLLRTKINSKITLVVGIVLLVISGFYFLPAPQGARGMAENWNYPSEAMVNHIIEEQDLQNFNVVNLEYDTLSHVQKYLLKKDGIEIDENNYFSNDYLFVVSRTPDYMKHPAYEVNSFVPSKQIESWPINSTYTMYLLKREIAI